jgi:hypothetical protein
MHGAVHKDLWIFKYLNLMSVKRPEREADHSELRMHGAVNKDLLIFKYLKLISVKRPEREADHSPSFCAEVKNAWSYTSTVPVSLYGV